MVTCSSHTPHATRHTSNVTRHTSQDTRYTSHVTRPFLQERMQQMSSLQAQAHGLPPPPSPAHAPASPLRQRSVKFDTVDASSQSATSALAARLSEVTTPAPVARQGSFRRHPRCRLMTPPTGAGNVTSAAEFACSTEALLIASDAALLQVQLPLLLLLLRLIVTIFHSL